MIQRQRRQGPFRAFLGVEPDLALIGVDQDVLVSQLCAFGDAGGAAGVHQHRRIVQGGRHGLGLGLRFVQHVSEPVGVGIAGDVHTVATLLLLEQGEEQFKDRRQVGLDVGDDHVAQVGVRANPFDERVHEAQGHADFSAGIFDLVSQFAGRVQGITGHDNASNAQDSIIGYGELGHVQ